MRGNLDRACRLEARSSLRILRWEGNQNDFYDEDIRCIRSVTERFESQLRDARDEAINSNDQDRRIALELKDRIAKPYASPAWLAFQASVLACQVEALKPYVPSSTEQLLASIGVGIAFAPLLSALRRERWVRQLGIEDSDGALERVLVDATLGSYALPAPWEWRGSEPRWGAAVFAAESIAGANIALFWHAGLQNLLVVHAAGFVGDLGACVLGVLAVATAAAGRALYFYDDALDGLPAEIKAAERLAANAETYFSMTARDAEVAALSTQITSGLAEAWACKFRHTPDTKITQLVLAFVSAAACALTWELAGRSALAPAIAQSFAALDIYVIRPDPELTRVTLPLDNFARAGAPPES